MEINCDLGEGVPDEDQIFPLIDAASIACGGHFGDEESILKSLKLAASFGKKVGAHPSYPDRENFGRKSMNMKIDQLIESVDHQIGLFQKCLTETNQKMDHIKWHGALYNDAAAREDLANGLTDYLLSEHPETTIFVPPHSHMERHAQAKGLETRIEIFGDRAYQKDYSLMPRSEKNSLFTSLTEVENQVIKIIEHNSTQVDSFTQNPIFAQTLCFHGDNPGLLTFLPQLRNKWWK